MKKITFKLLILLISSLTFGQNFYQNDNSFIKLVDGQNIRTTKNQSFEKGKVHLITYVMILSSCPPCTQEIINLNQNFKNLESTLSFDYSVVFIDPSSRLERTIAEARTRLKYYLTDFPIYFDENSYQGVIPNTIIVDKNGEIVYSKRGLKSEEEINNIHAKLIELNNSNTQDNKNIGLHLSLPYSESSEYLTSEIKEKIDKIVDILEEYKNTEFKIGIYANNDFKNIGNKEFSQIRADELKKYIIDKNIAKERIIACVGLGKNYTSDSSEINDEIITNKNSIEIFIYRLPFFTVQEIEKLTKKNLNEFDKELKANNFILNDDSTDFIAYIYDSEKEIKVITREKDNSFNLGYSFSSLYAFNNYKSELLRLGYNYLGQKTIDNTVFDFYKNEKFIFKFNVFKNSEGQIQYMLHTKYFD